MDYTEPNKRSEVKWIIQNQTYDKKLHELYKTKHTLRRSMNYAVPNTR
jgi:glutamate/tyrosine decarboxylase-like PLP-dependent enzyme